MTPLISTIMNGSSQVLEAPVVIAAALIAASVNSKPQNKAKVKSGSIDTRTMIDIGIEAGSITWLR